MVGCYLVIVNKNKVTYFTKPTLTHGIIGFNFGFFLTKFANAMVFTI